MRVAAEEGVDYVGLGPVWGTQTKKVSSPVVGPKGIGEMLLELDGFMVRAGLLSFVCSAYQPPLNLTTDSLLHSGAMFALSIHRRGG